MSIFDGGATLQADIENLRAIKESQILTVKVVESTHLSLGDEPYIVANDDYENYRAIVVYSTPYQNRIQLSLEQAKQLNVQNGAEVRILSINVQQASKSKAMNRLENNQYLQMAVN